MNLERYRRDLEAILRAQSELAFLRARGLADSDELGDEQLDRLADLTSDESILALHGLGESDRSLAPLIACVEVLAVAQRSQELFAELRARLAGEGLRGESGLVPLELAEVWLASRSGRDELERARRDLEAASSVRQDCIEELVGLRRDQLVPQPGSEPAGPAADGPLHTLGARLLEISAAPARELLGALLPRIVPEHGPCPAWTALPFFLGGEPLAAGLAEPDEQFVAYAIRCLGLQQATQGRLTIDLAGRGGKLPGEYRIAVEPGRDVHGSWRPLGRLRDYRGVLRVLGGCLPWALVEDADRLEMRLAGDAVPRVWAALLGSLTHDARWVESTFRKSLAPEIRAHWRAQHLIHLRGVAATLEPGVRGPAATLPAAPSAGTMTEATGFVHPELPVPWTLSPLHARLELGAESASAAIRDALATRFGSAWWRRSECGRYLRDLWAAGHADTGSLCNDVGAGPLGAGDLIEAWHAGA